MILATEVQRKVVNMVAAAVSTCFFSSITAIFGSAAEGTGKTLPKIPLT